MADILPEESRTVKQNTRDSVFTTLFSDVNNVLRLYKELHTEKTDTTVDDIETQTLKSVFINDLYNDLGFIVRDGQTEKYVFLIEAQSVWSKNITLRLLFYLSETYRRYLESTKQDVHEEKEVHLPKPELYVIYPGSKKLPDRISLKDTFFDGDAPIDLIVNVLRESDTDTIHGQYIGFCRVYGEQRKLYGNKLDCIRETIRICLEMGYLSEFLNAHKKEVVTMLSDLFDEKAQRESYDRAFAARIEEKAEAKGEERGKAIGEARGIIKTIVSLFKKGRLTLTEASEEANMSEKEFEEMAASMP